MPDGAGEWQIAGEAEDGRALFDRRFDMAEIADGDGWQSLVFALPTEAGWADAVKRIVLTARAARPSWTRRAAQRRCCLLDPATGRVRGTLRNWPDPGKRMPPCARCQSPAWKSK